MSSSNEQPGSAATPDQQPATSEDMQSMARRRAIFKGLSKGAALAGVSAPLASLATPTGQRMRLKKADNLYYRCTVSGNGSVALSQGTSGSQCGGRPASDYACSDPTKLTSQLAIHWPKWPVKNVRGSNCAVCYGQGGTAYTATTPFSTCFGWGVSDTIGALVHKSPDSDAAQWVTACLNATLYPNTFPYSAAEVVDFSNMNDSRVKANALSFFKNWLNKPGLA